MTRRALTTLTQSLCRQLGSPRRVLEVIADAMLQRRGMRVCGDDTVVNLREFEPLLARDDALGEVYQALSAPALEAAYRATARDRRKFLPEEIPAVTGLFTPKWVADFLVQNTLGKLWCDVRAERAARVCDIRLLDPACGTMNVGLSAIDLLLGMYREEMDFAGRPGWPAEPSVRDEREIPGSILRHNLFGTDIDPTALWLARLTLAMKLGVEVDSATFNLSTADALFAQITRRFDVVVTNPPYLSARNLPAETVASLKKAYPCAWRDLYTCFIERSIDLCRDGGRVGLLTMQSFMFTGAFERLRARIAERSGLEQLLHVGPGLWESGNPGTLRTVAFTLRRGAVREPLTATRLPDRHVFRVDQPAFADLPRRAWAYWASPAARRAFATMPRLRDLAPPRQGLATTDNARFVRYWWEVDCTGASPGRWFPYAKSGRFRRWYEAPRHRVNWENDGGEIKREIVRRYPYLDGDWQWVAKNSSWYGKPGGVTYSYLTSGRFSARRLEPGSIFDVAGSSLFPPDDPLTLLAILNSSAAAELLGVINPTLNFQVGDLAQMPVPPKSSDELPLLAARAIAIQRELDSFDETTTDFRQPVAWADADDVLHSLYGELRGVERKMDHIVAELYGIEISSGPGDDTQIVRADIARRWVSFAFGRVARQSEPVLQIETALIKNVRDELAANVGDVGAGEIETAVGGLAQFLARDFGPWHVRLYVRRPVYWAFRGAGSTVIVPHERANAQTIKRALRRVGGSPPRGWERCIDDGVLVNLAPLIDAVADPALRTALKPVAEDLAAGRLAWSETAKGLSPGSTGGCGRARIRRLRPTSVF